MRPSFFTTTAADAAAPFADAAFADAAFADAALDAAAVTVRRPATCGAVSAAGAFRRRCTFLFATGACCVKWNSHKLHD